MVPGRLPLGGAAGAADGDGAPARGRAGRGGLGAAVALADLGRFAYGVAALGYLNTALVWVFAHQLGYGWRDGRLRPARRRWALALGGLCALVVITSLGVYPRSLVALQGQERSHMLDLAHIS